jgi:hypothetical protein
LTLKSTAHTLPLFSEDTLVDPSFLSLSNFFNFSTEALIDTLDDSYENFKYIHFIYHSNYKNIIQLKSAPTYPLSYTHIIDNFRADYEDNS